MRRLSVLALVLATALAVASMAGCAPAAPSGAAGAAGAASTASGSSPTETVTLRITKDFGRTVLREVTATPAPGESVLSLLTKNAKVKTAYGGGFVNSIDELASSYTGLGVKQEDWFYVVNGIQPSCGAGEYTLAPGDSVWWDYRSWEFAVAIPAVVGQYPHPFVGRAGDAADVEPASGGSPTDVLSSSRASVLGDAVADVLGHVGANEVRQAPLSRATARPNGRHAVTIGRMSDIVDVPWIREALSDPGRSGTFARIGPGDRLMLVDTRGRPHDIPAGMGAVLATGGETPGTALWIVTGTGDAGVRAAANVIIDNPETFAGRFGVAVDASDTVIPLPVDPAWRSATSGSATSADSGGRP